MPLTLDFNTSRLLFPIVEQKNAFCNLPRCQLTAEVFGREDSTLLLDEIPAGKLTGRCVDGLLSENCQLSIRTDCLFKKARIKVSNFSPSLDSIP
jgi:hypothetical protein